MKFITTLFAMFFATASLADDVYLINPGSEEGAFRQVLTTIGEEIEHEFVQANNPVTAYTYFDKKNVVTVWSSEWPGDADLKSPKIDKDALVGLMTYETLMCSREFTSLDDMAGKQVKIATWGSEPVAKFLSKLGSDLGIDFIVVPFSGSGSTVKGYMGFDANTIFTITTKQAAIQEDAASKCFAFSENGDLAFRFVDSIVTVNADKKLTEKLRAIIERLRETEDWKNKFSGTVTYVGEEFLPMFDEAVENFSK